MELVLDFGNTHKKLALFDAGELKLAEFHPVISLQIISKFVDEHPGITSCILSSVVDHDGEITEFLSQAFEFINLDAGTPLPLKNMYSTKITLGKDRLAAAVAGSSAFPGKDVLVISAGTALTFDFVNAASEYLGGSISPGMQMRFNALHTFTDKLPLLSYQEVTELIGSDTWSSILSGVINGVVAEIEGIKPLGRSKIE